MRKTSVRACVALIALVLLPACEGPAGSEGPEGPTGAAGPAGQDGKDGQDGQDGQGAADLTYTLSSACDYCHAEIHKRWQGSGHAHAMVKIQGKKPDDPPYSVYPQQPPTDDKGKAYTWTDATYIIGGFGWKAAFTDAKGYVITGSNVEWNTKLKKWQAFEPSVAPGTMTTDCAKCHTTGFVSADDHEQEGTQDDLEGMPGKWIEDGVACERCHGKASIHVLAVGYAPIKVDRSAAACGKCHGSNPPGPIVARDGLIEQAQEWNQMATTKMRILGCVDCHDPHRSAKFDDMNLNPDKSIITKCETCHFKKVGKHAVAKHTQVSGGPTCVTCHMPPAVHSAIGNPAFWTGDQRAHLWRIHTDSTAPQLSADGKTVQPYLTLSYACRQCHSSTTDKTDATLESYAKGYHD